jgi:hypothetical protein
MADALPDGHKFFLNYDFESMLIFDSVETSLDSLSETLARLVALDRGWSDCSVADSYSMGLLYMEKLFWLLPFVLSPGPRVCSVVQSYSDRFGAATHAFEQAMEAEMVKEGEPWTRLLDYWSLCPSGLQESLKYIVSLRGGETMRSRLADLQLLHWMGWGGDGRFLAAMGSSGREPWTTLAKHINLSFGWSDDCERIGTRIRRHFLDPHVESVREYVAGVSALLASGTKKSEDGYRIWGDAVGWECRMELLIADRLQGLSESRKPSIEITATEIAEECVGRLRTTRHVCAAYVRDLLDEDRDGELLEYAEEVDVYSCAFAFHQVADDKSNQAEIRRLMRWATSITRVGGVISTPDAGRGRLLQVFILPMNLVDREGGWPGSFYLLRDAEGRRLHTLSDLSVALGAIGESVKLPLPLFELTLEEPFGVGMYQFTPHVVVTSPREDVVKFDRLLDTAGDLVAAFNDILHSFFPDVSRIVKRCKDAWACRCLAQ